MGKQGFIQDFLPGGGGDDRTSVRFTLYLSHSFPHISRVILLLNGKILGGGGGGSKSGHGHAHRSVGIHFIRS